MTTPGQDPSVAVPVTIIAGFLGAGKTTLLTRLLHEASGIRYGVLVNDFAAINVDAKLIQDIAPDRIALTNGCVCCTISDDLLSAALKLRSGQPRPEHILVECSGVSDPRAVARALTGELAGGAFSIQALVCLVDAANVMGLDFDDTEAVIDQAAASDLVLINKCDISEMSLVESIEHMLRDAQPLMRIARTTNAEVPLSLLTGTFAVPSIETARHGAEQDDHHHADAFTSRAWRFGSPLSLESFQAAVRRLPPSVYRAKGVLRFTDRPGQRAAFQLVGGRSELQFCADPGETSESLVVAIGRASRFDGGVFDTLFSLEAERAAAGLRPLQSAAAGGQECR